MRCTVILAHNNPSISSNLTQSLLCNALDTTMFIALQRQGILDAEQDINSRLFFLTIDSFSRFFETVSTLETLD